jgi:formylglycine-generating enzyme required for sulfatase activity
VPGGSFFRSYDGVTEVAGDDCCLDHAYPATVSAFRLDAYEVTVGRFRQFVAAWNAGWRPTAGAGKHGHLAGGLGLTDSGSFSDHEHGWDASWIALSGATTWDLVLQRSCDGTWTQYPGLDESEPVTCVDWFGAYAFCIWDGGFLPSEAEWNYAASGGLEQRVYPWSQPPGASNIDCTTASSATEAGACVPAWPSPVGQHSPQGDGRWGHADLASNVAEWTLDWQARYAPDCVDCALLSTGTSRVVRGGSFDQAPTQLLASRRDALDPSTRSPTVGVRCARVP